MKIFNETRKEIDKMFCSNKSQLLLGKKYFLTSLILLSALVFMSCTGAYTEMSGTWKKPGYTAKKFNNILVVAISDDVVKRNSVESAIVSELGKNNIKATTSSFILDLSNIEKDKDGKIDSTKREEIRKKVSEAGYDGAIVVSLLDIKEKTEYVPGQTYYQPRYYSGFQPYMYSGFYNYSFTTYSIVNTPGYYVEKKDILIETRLFDLKSDDMVWAAQSETLNPSSMGGFSKSLADAVVNSMISGNAIK